MDTKVLEWNQLEEAATLLKRGEVVCFPTETVYGMGALCSKQECFDKLVTIKRRPPEKPFTLMCANFTQAMEYAELDVRVLSVMHAFMPGEITVLVKPRKNIPSWMTLGSPYIGIRIPNSPEVLDLIDRVGVPLLVPSANVSGEKTSVSFEETLTAFNGSVAAVIRGECHSCLASTIVLFGEQGLKLVRQGPISFEAIEKAYASASFSVSLGSDHGGFGLKNSIRKHLEERGFHVLDEGTDSVESGDYPFFAYKAAEDVRTGKANLGILCCTSGEGVMMVANKVKGIRCGLGYDDVVTGKCREHNNANMISFGAAYMEEEDVLRRVDIFLAEKFSPLEKHHRRVKEICSLEQQHSL